METPCQLCLVRKHLVKAHIYPEAFWRRLRAGNRPITIYSTVKGFIPKRAPVGVYDESILCQSCDQKIGRWDDYAQSVLSEELQDTNCLIDGEDKIAYVLKNIDYKRLRLFFVSLLWRADRSSQDFFRVVDVGPFQERLRNLLLNEDPGDPDEFSVIIFRWEGEANQVVFAPRKRRLEHRAFYEFTFGGYSPVIKVDRQTTPDSLKDYILKPNSDLFIFTQKLAGSSYPDRIRRAIKASRLNLFEKKRYRSKKISGTRKWGHS